MRTRQVPVTRGALGGTVLGVSGCGLVLFFLVRLSCCVFFFLFFLLFFHFLFGYAACRPAGSSASPSRGLSGIILPAGGMLALSFYLQHHITCLIAAMWTRSCLAGDGAGGQASTKAHASLNTRASPRTADGGTRVHSLHPPTALTEVRRVSRPRLGIRRLSGPVPVSILVGNYGSAHDCRSVCLHCQHLRGVLYGAYFVSTTPNIAQRNALAEAAQGAIPSTGARPMPMGRRWRRARSTRRSPCG